MDTIILYYNSMPPGNGRQWGRPLIKGLINCVQIKEIGNGTLHDLMYKFLVDTRVCIVLLDNETALLTCFFYFDLQYGMGRYPW